MNEYGTSSIVGLAEPVSSLTHLAAAAAFALMSVPMLRRAWRSGGLGQRYGHPGLRVASVAVFAVSVVVQLVISGIYHITPFGSSGRAALLQADYMAIFVLIAATFTPACVILFRGAARWVPLLLIWAAAGCGITVTAVANLPASVGYACYLAMGWVGIFGVTAIWRRHGASLLDPLLQGAAAYTAGAAIQMAYQPTLIPGIVGPHEIFHLAVVIGIAFHWLFVYRLAGLPAVQLEHRPLEEEETTEVDDQLAIEAAS